MAAPKSSAESDKAIEESQAMTCWCFPPSPSYFLKWLTVTDVPPSPPRPFSPFPPPSPSSKSMVAYLVPNKSMESPPQFQQHEDICLMEVFEDEMIFSIHRQLQNLQLIILQEWHQQLQLRQRQLQLLPLPTQPPSLQPLLQLLPRPPLLPRLQPPLQLPLLRQLRKLQPLQRPVQLQHPLLPPQRLQHLQQLLLLKLRRLPAPLQLLLLISQLQALQQPQLMPPRQSRNDALNLSPKGNIGTFNTAVAAKAPIGRDQVDVGFSVLNKNRAKPKVARIIGIQPQPTQQEDDPDENSVSGCKEATGNDEIEATREDEMAEGGLKSGCFRKGKRKVKTSGGERETKKSGVRIGILLDDILQTKGMSLNNAAINFDVSRSTLKRVCREYGIPRWPPRKNNEFISNSLPTETPMDVDQERIPQSSYNILPTNQASASGKINSVTVKARYENRITIKFQLSSPWRRVELEQQVERRLELEAGTYHIKYKDEANELILIACDDDLEDYISDSRSKDASSIEVFLSQSNQFSTQ